MTWTTLEQSIENSRVVEIYLISTDSETFRYTSHPIDYNWEGEVYSALPIARTDVASNSSGGTDTKVVLSISAGIVSVITGVPPQRMSVVAYRIQTDESVSTKFIDGPVTDRNVTNDSIEFRVTDPLSDTVEAEIPTVRISTMCNHALYDVRCAVARASFDQATVVDNLDLNGTEITVNSVGGQADQWFTDGEIVTYDGQRRTIVSQVGLVLRIRVAFNNLVDGQSVIIYAGCNHLIETCFSKFNNVANFGGHPRVPSKNPFWNRLLGRDEEY